MNKKSDYGEQAYGNHLLRKPPMLAALQFEWIIDAMKWCNKVCCTINLNNNKINALNKLAEAVINSSSVNQFKRPYIKDI
ncbi:hypothetical protein BpHYR1_019637 [Brachionus plicatilis]|uniref:Uncharacterized protein n=1 Tax=Brachionus plicatilis TaxID=10195 RepID=A0A3M7PT15_BRAPC|nr:hypothetical protein BpHYR1_019637 [Brachionus plicatilis]